MNANSHNPHAIKIYGHPYSGILCIKTKYALTRLERTLFIEGKTYPFTSIAFETTGSINPNRPIQIVAEDGYKVLFLGDEVNEFFDISHVHTVVPKILL